MRAVVALLVLSLRQVARSRGFLAGAGIVYALLFLLSFGVSGSGPPAGTVKFYLTVAWLLLFRFSLSDHLRVKCRASRGMSSRRSLSAGILSETTLSR